MKKTIKIRFRNDYVASTSRLIFDDSLEEQVEMWEEGDIEEIKMLWEDDEVLCAEFVDGSIAEIAKCDFDIVK